MDSTLQDSLILLAFILFPLGGKTTAILAALISIFVLVNELLELSFQNNPFRWMLPKGQSQNVFAVIPPAGEHQRDLVLVGHMDSQRTPILFSTRGWVKFYDRFTMIVFIAIIVQIILYSLAIFIEIPWAWYGSIPTALCALLLAVMFLQAEASPFTAGANDNASAVGIVLTLAEEFSNKPLQHTRVYAVCTGCEEVQHYVVGTHSSIPNVRRVSLGAARQAHPAAEGRTAPRIPFTNRAKLQARSLK